MNIDIGVLINLVTTCGGLITVYVRISDRLTKLETHMEHLLESRKTHRRDDTL